MRVIKNNNGECPPETEIVCQHCGSEIAYSKDDICYDAKDHPHVLCPCCREAIWLDDDVEPTPETINYPADFYQFTTKCTDEELTEQVKEAIKQMKEDGELGYVAGDALVIALKDYEDSNYAYVFVCKNYAESSVKIS